MIDYFDVINEECEKYYNEKSDKSPVKMAAEIMHREGFPMHSPHHHFITPAVLVTAACIASDKDRDAFKSYIDLARKRAVNVPGAYCGEFGACGAAVGCGIFSSVWHGTTPLSGDSLGKANTITARGLSAIGAYDAPRCCKRVTFLALNEAVDFINECFDVKLKKEKITCDFFKGNRECLGKKCYFSPAAEI